MTVRMSGSHKRYLDAGCIMTRSEVGNPMPYNGSPKEIHYYGPCASCGKEMRDVDANGYEDCSGSPYDANYYGPPDVTICTACAHTRYMNGIDLSGRNAMCPYCEKRVQSGWGLAFFEYKKDRGIDTYYCGCRGWD